MAIILSHTSALECLRASSAGALLRSNTACRRASQQFETGGKPQLETGAPSGCTLPLHVLVHNRDQRVESKALVAHVWGSPLPPNSLALLRDGTLTSSPEFVFLQMASDFRFTELVMLGFELCGLFRDIESEEFPAREEPLTSVARIQAFLDSVPGARGHKHAVSALRFVRDNAASPMEAMLVMLLCLPRVKGGYGAPFPQLNYKVNLTKEEQRAVQRHHFVCDLYFEKPKLCLEYNSRLIHENDEHMNEDAARANALKLRGIEVVAVTNRQVFDEAKLRNIARIVLSAHGMAMRPDTEKTCRRRAILRNCLFRRLR